ncbi:ATP-binding cassette domain-containing protein [Formosa maritima]|uniref:ATP-binding cassette domain-containing protein n=1 Tax=Formosa maritima TaxID=2592046 RepID=A0A5D0G2S0_9FLAO|nr:ATP-binding cassette domain-containing protein [Formosa maritima]TYA52659.1 ATP-binding cassette domain-containing protein [Formosa maritima]
MNVLEIRNLHKSYKNKIILNNLDLSCKTEDVIGIFGRNGSGKSTLLKIIFGTVKAESAQIKINSKILSQKEIISSKSIGYLPQVTFLPKELKVRDIIPFFYPNGDDQNKIFYAPKVSSFEKIKVGHLSIGQLRYLELLLIGNLDHSFLLLDEPFSMIEPLYKEVIKNLLIELKNTKGLIITDHYFDDVLEITTNNFIIKDAEKIEINSKKDLVKFQYLSSN